MSYFRVTIYWHQSTIGVSETYWSRAYSSVSLDQPVADINELLDARVQMLFNDQFVDGVRVAIIPSDQPSLPRSRRQSQFFTPGSQPWPSDLLRLRVPTIGAIVIAQDDFQLRPDQVRVAAQLQCFYSPTQSTVRYLAGVPDGLTTTDGEPTGFDKPAINTWKNAYLRYLAVLVSKWGVRARTSEATDPYFPIRGLKYNNDTDKLLTVVLGQEARQKFAKGDRIQLQHSRRKPGYLGTLNGQWDVDSIVERALPLDQDLVLRGAKAIDPDSFKKLGEIRLVRWTVLPFGIIRIQRIGIHKRGKPGTSPRGRRLTRVLLDP